MNYTRLDGGTGQGMMKRKPKSEKVKQKPAASAKCTHYWIIESPRGPTSTGICKFCGAVSEFANYMPYATWDSKISNASQKSDLYDAEAYSDIDIEADENKEPDTDSEADNDTDEQ